MSNMFYVYLAYIAVFFILLIYTCYAIYLRSNSLKKLQEEGFLDAGE